MIGFIQTEIESTCGDLYSSCASDSACSAEFDAALLADEMPTAGHADLMSLLECVDDSGIEVYSYRVGYYSLAGAACVPCGSGKEPHSATQGSCVDCLNGEYSGGDMCRSCAPGTQPSSDKGRCDACT